MGWLINNHFGLRHMGSVVLPRSTHMDAGDGAVNSA